MSNHVEARSGRRSFLIFGCAVSLLASAAHGGDPTQIEFDLAGMGYGAAADGWLDPASPNYNAVEMAAEAGRRVTSADWIGVNAEVCFNDGATASNWASEIRLAIRVQGGGW